MSLLSCEGIDGSGKSTVIERVSDELDITTTAEPSDLWTGKAVRECLSDPSIDPLSNFYFFMGDRINHVEKTVKPLCNDGRTVITDRYTDSTRAYQPVALAKSDYFDSQTEAKLFIEETMAAWEYEQDLTIYIDISVDTALNRCEATEKYENREFLEKVKQNYDALIAAEPERFAVIDGEQSEDEVASDVMEILENE